MYCIYCGRLCDFDESHGCEECRQKVNAVSERVCLISVLKEAYPQVDGWLKRKIDRILKEIEDGKISA